MEVKKRAEIIQKWIEDYCNSVSFELKSLIVGISGGVDSSVVSTLCALTGRKTIVLSMPIKQKKTNMIWVSYTEIGYLKNLVM